MNKFLFIFKPKVFVYLVDVAINPTFDSAHNLPLLTITLHQALPQQELLLQHEEILPTFVNLPRIHELEVHLVVLFLIRHLSCVAGVRYGRVELRVPILEVRMYLPYRITCIIVDFQVARPLDLHRVLAEIIIDVFPVRFVDRLVPYRELGLEIVVVFFDAERLQNLL